MLPHGNRGAGNLRFTLTLDVANDVVETNAQGLAEVNNDATITLASTLAPYPDLVVTDLSPVPAVGWLAGDTVTVTWKTRNQGDGATSGSWIETLGVRNLSNGQTLFTVNVSFDAVALGNLAAGGVQDRSAVLTWPSGANANGRIEFTVTTDTASQIFENNLANTAESNNAAQSIILSSPDLIVSNLGSDVLAPRTGDLITLTWDDVNSGNAAIAGGWLDRVLVVNQTTPIQLLNQQVRFDPPAGQTTLVGAIVPRSFSFRVPDGNAGAGNLQIQITADLNTSGIGTISEVNAGGTGESNNTRTLNLTSTLAVYPDLVVTDVIATPAFGWLPGDTVSVTWKTRNQGDDHTSGSVVGNAAR